MHASSFGRRLGDRHLRSLLRVAQVALEVPSERARALVAEAIGADLPRNPME